MFLREYTIVDGKPEATGRLLDGVNGGLPTWAEVKEQARDILGIDLTDYHVGNLPLLATDAYGNFIPNNAAEHELRLPAGRHGRSAADAGVRHACAVR